MKADFLPIILGSDENAYGNARLFAEAYGVKPLLLCTRQLVPTMFSRLFRIEVIPGFDRPEIFRSALLQVMRRESDAAEKMLVVPCIDYYAALLSEYYDCFEGLIANRFISKPLLDELTAKHRFYALCGEYGLPYPETLVIPPEERAQAAERLPAGWPVVLKPENSNASAYLDCSFAGKKKVYYLHSAGEYRQTADAMTAAGYNGTLVAQEYIPGGDAALWVANAYSDADGHVRAVALGQVLLEEREPTMRGNNAAIISRYDEALMTQIKDFLESIRYVGFSNLDMKVDARTGKIVFFELNPRLARTSFFLRAAGFNIMRTFAEDVVYGRREDCVFVDSAALWRNVPMFVLKKYVQDRKLLEEAETLARAGKSLCTRYCREDRSIRRTLKMLRYDAAQVRSFLRWFSAD